MDILHFFIGSLGHLGFELRRRGATTAAAHLSLLVGSLADLAHTTSDLQTLVQYPPAPLSLHPLFDSAVCASSSVPVLAGPLLGDPRYSSCSRSSVRSLPHTPLRSGLHEDLPIRISPDVNDVTMADVHHVVASVGVGVISRPHRDGISISSTEGSSSCCCCGCALPPLSLFLVRSLDMSSPGYRPEFRSPKRCSECRQRNVERRLAVVPPSRVSSPQVIPAGTKRPRVGRDKRRSKHRVQDMVVPVGSLHSRSELFEPFEPIQPVVAFQLRRAFGPFEPFAAPMDSPIAPVVSPLHSSMVVPCDDACLLGDGQLPGGMEDVRFAVAPRGGRAKRRLKAFVVDFLKKPASGSQAEQDQALAAAVRAHKAGRQLHLTGMEMADREAARLYTIENRLSERTKEQALAAHFAERTTRMGEGGSHPSRSARLERKHRARRLPPCTHHIQVLLRHRHLAESAADITVGARRSDKLLRTWLNNIRRLDRAHLAIVLGELDAARIVHLRDLLKGFLSVDGHGGDHVFIEAERAHTILASLVAEDLDLVSAVEPFDADTPGVKRFVGPIDVGVSEDVGVVTS